MKNLVMRMAGRVQLKNHQPRPPTIVPEEHVSEVIHREDFHRVWPLSERTPAQFTFLRRNMRKHRASTTEEEGKPHWSINSSSPICPPWNKNPANYVATYGTGQMCKSCVDEAQRSHGPPGETTEAHVKGKSRATPYRDDIYSGEFGGPRPSRTGHTL